VQHFRPESLLRLNMLSLMRSYAPDHILLSCRVQQQSP
jgi:hypothetical protein